MVANGENMVRKWLKATHVPELIIDVPWPLAVQLENK